MYTQAIFKSKLTLEYKDPEIETEFKSYKKASLREHSLLIAGMCIIFGLIVTICLFQYDYTPDSYFIYAVSATFITFISPILLLTFRQYYIMMIVGNTNFYMFCIYIGYLKYFLVNVVGINYAACYGVMALETSVKLCFFISGLTEFKYSCVCTTLQLIVHWTICIKDGENSLEFYINTVLCNIVTSLTLVICYFSTFQSKTSFFYLEQTNRNIKWHRSILNHMSAGFISVENMKIQYINKEIAHILKNSQLSSGADAVITKDDTFEDTQVVEAYSQEILNFLLSEIQPYSVIEKEVPIQVKSNKKEAIIFFNKFKLDYENEKKFVLVGTKTMKMKTEEELTFEIFCRYNHDTFDLIFNDITRTKIIEAKNAEFKFKSIFLAKVAHEFKNPLICISELVNQINDKLKPKVINNINILTKSNISADVLNIKALCNYLLILMKDLDFFSASQVYQGNPNNKCDLSDTNLNEILEFCKEITVALVNKYNKKHLVQPIMYLGNDVPNIIRTDEFKLKQILVNLLSNSVKFTSKGHIELSIVKEADMLKFSVSDTGSGINDAHNENLFKPFFKSKEQCNKIGTGLGLSIVKDLTRVIGAELLYSTHVEKGTDFWILLPIQEQSQVYTNDINDQYDTLDSRDTTDLQVRVIPISAKTINLTTDDLTIQFKPRRILFSQDLLSNISLFSVNDHYEGEEAINIIVADDEQLTRQAAIRTLNNSAKKNHVNINIIQVQDGVETLFYVYKYLSTGQKIGSILSDETMEYMRGSESAELVKKLCYGRTNENIPFYILTAFENQYIYNPAVKDIFCKPLGAASADKIIHDMIESTL